MTLLTSVLSLLFAPFVAASVLISSAFAPVQEQPYFGSSEPIPTTIAFFETTLAGAITSNATSFNLTSATDKDGTTLASSTYAFVVDEGSSNEEIVIADCTGTACTNALRGISARTGNTEVVALKKAHRRGASVKITDAPILMLVSRILRGEGEVSYTPSTGGNLVTKDYVDSLALGSTTVAASYTDDGIGELATGAEAASSTLVGGSGSPLFLHTGVSTSTGGTAYTVPITNASGTLDSGFFGVIASTTSFTIGSTPVLSIGKNIWASTTAGTSTWSVPIGIKTVKVTVTGGGGGGGSCSTGSGNEAGGGGGGAGSTAIAIVDVSATTSIQIVVGAGGIATLAGSPSKFGSTIIAGAGNGGFSEDKGGDTSPATGGYINILGGGGEGGESETSAGFSHGGAGGASFFGGGGRGTVGTNVNGYIGQAYGSGGGGAGCGSSASQTGGTGATGIVLIEY